jgi:hypothetical protein
MPKRLVSRNPGLIVHRLAQRLTIWRALALASLAARCRLGVDADTSAPTLCRPAVTTAPAQHVHPSPLPTQSGGEAAEVDKDELKDQRNDFEDLCLTRLKQVLPEGVAGTILADRGFGDVKLFEFLDRLVSAFVFVFVETW